MQSTVELYPYDFVLVKSNGDFYKFEDGEVIIFAKRESAVKASEGFPASKVVSTTRLSRRERKALRQNIKKYNEIPF